MKMMIIKSFAISLKAEWYSLNLISADMVIHYDPIVEFICWEINTDRTYRIGQSCNVPSLLIDY